MSDFLKCDQVKNSTACKTPSSFHPDSPPPYHISPSSRGHWSGCGHFWEGLWGNCGGDYIQLDFGKSVHVVCSHLHVKWCYCRVLLSMWQHSTSLRHVTMCWHKDVALEGPSCSAQPPSLWIVKKDLETQSHKLVCVGNHPTVSACTWREVGRNVPNVVKNAKILHVVTHNKVIHLD